VGVIETQALTKAFSRRTDYRALWRLGRRHDLVAVDAVDLVVEEGELFGLLGPNGAGKTTLTKLLCTLILPTSGRATVCGHDVVADAADVRREVGLVDCQDRSFFWRLSGWQNLLFFAALVGLHGAQARRRIAELVDLVGLEGDIDRRFMTYSSGMRQRLAIARGLLSMPLVVFMDEPTRSLDPVTARDLRRFIREILVDALGRTVVLVTHRLEEAEELCDRVAIMNHGRVLACSPAEDIKRRISARLRYTLRVRRLAPEVLAPLRGAPGVADLCMADANSHGVELQLLLADEDTCLPGLIREIVTLGGDIVHCQSQGLSLEEAFVQMVQGSDDGIGTT
jgi:ABC-2 type transport system ATP-binding protein